MCLLSVTYQPRLLSLLVAAMVSISLASAARANSAAHVTAPVHYGLDAIPRVVGAHGRVHCPKVKLVRYRGTTVRYATRITVYPGFRTRLTRFERIVAEVAKQVYGRKPYRIRHWGGYTCRRMSTDREYMSEHALGNAIDVYGFDFTWVSRRKARRLGIPMKLRRGFHIRVAKHWRATRGIGKVHARFLRLLFKRLVAQRNVFTVLLGPGYPGHENHFHFDVAPWRLVSIDM